MMNLLLARVGHAMHFGTRLVTVALILLLSACAGPSEQTRKRFFWPPGGAEPRIEYINFFQVEQDIRRGRRIWLEEYIFGKEQPQHMFQQPQGIISDCRSGKVYISDIASNRVFLYDFSNSKVMKLKDASGSDFNGKVWSLAVDDQGLVYGSLGQRGEIVVFDAQGKLRGVFGKGELANPAGLAIDRTRQRLLVTDTKKQQLFVYSLDGKLLSVFGDRGEQPGEFNFPTDVDVDADGNVFVLDSMNARVQEFDPNLQFVRSFGERGTAPGSFMIAKSLAVSPQGHVYVTDALAHRVVIFDREGNYLLTFGGKHFVSDQVAPGGFYLPSGIDVDCNGSIWVADSLNRMFHKFQYLDDRYLKEHPILPGQAQLPEKGTKETSN